MTRNAWLYAVAIIAASAVTIAAVIATAPSGSVAHVLPVAHKSSPAPMSTVARAPEPAGPVPLRQRMSSPKRPDAPRCDSPICRACFVLRKFQCAEGVRAGTGSCEEVYGAIGAFPGLRQTPDQVASCATVDCVRRAGADCRGVRIVE